MLPRTHQRSSHLKKLDRKAKRPAEIFGYTFGIITVLVTGFGMCLSMQIIGSATKANFIFGVIIEIIGLIGMGGGKLSSL